MFALLTVILMLVQAKEMIQVCRPKDDRNPFLMGISPTIPYSSTAKYCNTIHGRQLARLTNRKRLAKGAEVQKECLGEGSLAWIWGMVTEQGCPALLLGSQGPITTYVNCAAHLPTLCQYPVCDDCSDSD